MVQTVTTGRSRLSWTSLATISCPCSLAWKSVRSARMSSAGKQHPYTASSCGCDRLQGAHVKVLCSCLHDTSILSLQNPVLLGFPSWFFVGFVLVELGIEPRACVCCLSSFSLSCSSSLACCFCQLGEVGNGSEGILPMHTVGYGTALPGLCTPKFLVTLTRLPFCTVTP